MPLQATSGAASQDAFGGNGVAVVPTYIEDVFSCFLYTGTNATQTIVNGIDLATKGGMIWFKDRSASAHHQVWDSARGISSIIYPSATNGAGSVNAGTGVTSFNTNGFSLGTNYNGENTSGDATVSWTFRKQPKFFDVVTWTGDGVATGRTIYHQLGSKPAVIIFKKTSGVGPWSYTQTVSGTEYFLRLNTTVASDFNNTSGGGYISSNNATSTYFDLFGNGGVDYVNTTGATYIAYLFAHDAGGFGLTGTDNVISCGSFTTNGSGVATVNLGYEPQFVLFKRTDSAGHSWEIIDTMRGFSVNSNGTSGNVQRLNANSSGAETNSSAFEMYLTSTGFATNQYFYNATYIYIAIRRGPMRTPTVGTSVFTPILTGSGATLSDSYSAIGFPIDMTLRYQTGTDTDGAYKNAVYTRLMGINSGATDTPTSANNPNLLTHSTAAQGTTYYYSQTGSMGLDYGGSWSAPAYVLTHLHFRRAPSFMDVVCFTGTGSNIDVTHNLGVTPEFIIGKARSYNTGWICYHKDLGSTGGYPNYIVLNSTNASNSGASTIWRGVSSTTFSYGTNTTLNFSGITYVAYLFATCAGVSKVGSYTGTAATLQIDCGFTAGARFVLIKRTDSTGDWYVWDTARGIVSGNDPYLLLNSTAAEVTNTDYIDTYSAGFEISSTAPAAINANGGSFIFFAVA